MRIAWPTLSTRMSKTDTVAATATEAAAITTTTQKPSDDNSNWKEKVANEQQQQQQQTETKTTTIKLLVKTFSIKKLKSRKPLKQSDPQAWSEFESESTPRRVRVELSPGVFAIACANGPSSSFVRTSPTAADKQKETQQQQQRVMGGCCCCCCCCLLNCCRWAWVGCERGRCLVAGRTSFFF